MSKSCPKIVKNFSKSCKKLSKNYQTSCQKFCQKVVKKLKIQQTVVGDGVGWGWEGRGNSSSKAFGISFADRPKAKNNDKK
jgi:hypothetical protein